MLMALVCTVAEAPGTIPSEQAIDLQCHPDADAQAVLGFVAWPFQQDGGSEWALPMVAKCNRVPGLQHFAEVWHDVLPVICCKSARTLQNCWKWGAYHTCPRVLSMYKVGV